MATFDGGTVTTEEVERERARPTEATDESAPAPEDPERALAERVALREILLSGAGRGAAAAALQAAEESVLRDARVAELGWDGLTVSDAELRRRYDEDPSRYRDPEKVRLQDIYLRSEEGIDTAQQRRAAAERLEGLRREIDGGADFAALARAHSDSATANGGGWMVLKATDKVMPAFAEAVWSLEPGELSEVIDTPNGFHLVRVAARIPPVDRSFEDVREFVRTETLREERDDAEAEYLETTGARLGLERRYERLNDPFLPLDEALVRLGDRAFTFQQLIEQLPEAYQVHLFNRSFGPPRRFLDKIALSWTVLEDARREGLDEEPEVARRMAEARDQVRFDARLSELLDERVERVPEEELEEYFEANRQRYQTLATMTLRVILLDLEEGTLPWDTLKEAEALVERLRAGEDFGEMARRLSVHYSARDGGLLEDLTDYGLGRQVQSRARNRKIIADLEPGEISAPFVAEVYDPVHLRFERTGVYIVRLESRRPPHQAELAEVEELVKANYRRRFYQQLRADVQAEQLQRAGFRMHDR